MSRRFPTRSRSPVPSLGLVLAVALPAAALPTVFESGRGSGQRASARVDFLHHRTCLASGSGRSVFLARAARSAGRTALALLGRLGLVLRHSAQDLDRGARAGEGACSTWWRSIVRRRTWRVPVTLRLLSCP